MWCGTIFGHVAPQSIVWCMRGKLFPIIATRTDDGQKSTDVNDLT